MVSKIDSVSKWFIVEVPDCNNEENTLLSSTAPHVHFFNQFSFEKAFENVECRMSRMTIRTSKDMLDGRSVLVAYRLPINMSLKDIQLWKPLVTIAVLNRL